MNENNTMFEQSKNKCSFTEYGSTYIKGKELNISKSINHCYLLQPWVLCDTFNHHQSIHKFINTRYPLNLTVLLSLDTWTFGID